MHIQSLLWLSILAAVSLLQCSTVSAASWRAIYEPSEITIHMSESAEISLTLEGVDTNALLTSGAHLEVRTDRLNLAAVDRKIEATDLSAQGGWTGMVQIDALFLGLPMIFVEIINADGSVRERSDERLPVTIIREVRTIDHVFTGSVATLVSILYINFGAALSLPRLRSIAVRPIGPAIGFFGQFLVMPLVGFYIYLDICIHLNCNFFMQSILL